MKSKSIRSIKSNKTKKPKTSLYGFTSSELDHISSQQSKADALVADPESPYYEPDVNRRLTASRELMGHWEDEKAKRTRYLKANSPNVIAVLKNGIESGRITEAEFQEHQNLAIKLADLISHSVDEKMIAVGEVCGNEDEKMSIEAQIADIHSRMTAILKICL